MGADKPYTAAELRQKERDQSDPAWLAWLADMDSRVELFRTDTAPGLPADPWTAAGLEYTEMLALQRFSTVESVDLPENRDIADQIHRFIGEVFRRNFDGQWYNVPEYDDEHRTHGFGPVIRLPYTEMYMDVIPLLTAAMHHRTGSEWSTIFGYQSESHSKWADTGRLPLAEWVKIRTL